jgi:hypothetical protein
MRFRRNAKLEPEMLVVVHEGMPGFGILLHIVRYECTSERAFQFVGDTLLPTAFAAIAPNNRARCLEEGIDIGRKLASVINARCREAAARHEQQRESTTHAEADHADLTGATGLAAKPKTTCLDIIERGAFAFHQISGYCTQTAKHSSAIVQIDGKGNEPCLGEPVGLASVVLAHSPHVVQHNGARVWFRTWRFGKVARHPAA